jgi:hypothetical protein
MLRLVSVARHGRMVAHNNLTVDAVVVAVVDVAHLLVRTVATPIRTPTRLAPPLMLGHLDHVAKCA